MKATGTAKDRNNNLIVISKSKPNPLLCKLIEDKFNEYKDFWNHHDRLELYNLAIEYGLVELGKKLKNRI